jgi:hypothetical protein
MAIKSKTGLSQMVTTLLLVMLGIAAVGVLAGIILKIVNVPKLAPEFSCLEWQLNPPLSIQQACYNLGTGDMEVSLYRGDDKYDIERIFFQVQTSDGSHIWQCGENCGECLVLSAGDNEKYYFNASGFGEPKRISLSLFGCTFSERGISACSK